MHNDHITSWIAAADDETQKTFREAVHTILFAIASSTNLQPHMIMKGGILMAIRYETGRFTTDIDFSTTTHYRDFASHQAAFLETFGKAIQSAVQELPYQLDCRLQGTPKIKPRADGNFQTLQMKVGYARIGTKDHARLNAGAGSKTVQIDYSFNELVQDIDLLEVDDTETVLQAYGELTQVAEKLRAILQQVERERARGQDIYDLHHWLNHHPMEDAGRKAALLMVLKEKAASRELEITRASMANPAIQARARPVYDALADTITGELPPFDEAFGAVQAFYESLPWTDPADSTVATLTVA